MLDDSAADAYSALLFAARSDGIQAPSLEIVSAYRDFDTQDKLYKEALAKYGSPNDARKHVAPPGHSDHEKGIAIDFNIGGLSMNDKQSMKIDPSYRWLVKNAHRFGFSENANIDEPWHWVFRGKVTSTIEKISTSTKILGGLVLGALTALAIREYA